MEDGQGYLGGVFDRRATPLLVDEGQFSPTLARILDKYSHNSQESSCESIWTDCLLVVSLHCRLLVQVGGDHGRRIAGLDPPQLFFSLLYFILQDLGLSLHFAFQKVIHLLLLFFVLLSRWEGKRTFIMRLRDCYLLWCFCFWIWRLSPSYWFRRGSSALLSRHFSTFFFSRISMMEGILERSSVWEKQASSPTATIVRSDSGRDKTNWSLYLKYSWMGSSAKLYTSTSLAKNQIASPTIFLDQSLNVDLVENFQMEGFLETEERSEEAGVEGSAISLPGCDSTVGHNKQMILLIIDFTPGKFKWLHSGINKYIKIYFVMKIHRDGITV